ncbi:MAG: ferric reductase-like transmembrane domain-containing protein [Thermodesulfobacteriota bacterium]
MRFLRSTFWIGVYFGVAMAPLLAMLIGQPPPGRGFWREFSVGLGFAGLSMMGLQFFLTGRFKNITAPYGIDVVYHFHRAISLIAFSFLFLHAGVLLLSSPDLFVLLYPSVMPGWMLWGAAGFIAFVVVILSSLFRLPLGLNYERWRLLHGYVSVAAVVLAVAHVVGVDYYTESPVKRGLWIAMVIAWLLALVHVRLIKSSLMRKHPYLIERVAPERGRSWTLHLRPVGHGGMNFKPGQFAWLTVGKSPFTIREHPFSFSSSALEAGGAIRMTVKELGDFTSGIGGIPPGTHAYLDGPYGSFTIDGRDAPGFCFIAGGVGITPIMSILHTMADRRDRRPALLFYGSRCWEEITFREELDTLAERLNLKVIHVLQEAPAGWTGEQGRVTAELLTRHLPENRMQMEYFLCGPEAMQKAMKAALDNLGLPLENIQSESFNFV